MHNWGDKDFDWKGLDEAITFIETNLVRWGRINVTQAKEKFGCYDSETMVLTKFGWKLFKDVDIKNDEIATLKDGYLVYVKATNKVNIPYSGEMYQINTRGVDLLVTPGHFIYASKADKNGGDGNSGHKTYPYELQTYSNLFRKPKNFLKGARWVGNSPDNFIIHEYKNSWVAHNSFVRNHVSPEMVLPIKPLLKLLGWYIAEGYGGRTQVSFALNGNTSEPYLVSDIVRQLGFNPKSTVSGSRGVVVFYSKQMCDWLVEECGVGASNKKVPKFIKELSPELINIFLEALYSGDGHKAETSHILYTVSKTLALDVMELLLKGGFCGSLSSVSPKESVYDGRLIKGKYDCYAVSKLKNTVHRTINSHDTKEDIERKETTSTYTGRVYCLTVPGHLLYVMRGGKPVWCGNTARIYCSLGWYQFHNITHPRTVYNRYPKWLWELDCYYGTKIVPFLFGWVVHYHAWLYRKVYSMAVKKYPHLREEILCCADYDELLEGL
jgi:replicative DNA helicase Mcm